MQKCIDAATRLCDICGMEYYHGSHKHLDFTPHEGICLTTAESVAERYACRDGVVFELKLDLSGLTVQECEGYDRDEDSAPADSAAYRAEAAGRGVDVLVYDDETPSGVAHKCFRLISQRALDALCA